MEEKISKMQDKLSKSNTSKGKFITFEGVDGTGKSTQCRFLSDKLAKLGIESIILREPGGTIISERIRDILLDNSLNNMTMETELLLFEAARAQIVREVIEPELNKGIWIICDRFMDSSLAYQGYGRGLDITLIDKLNAFAVGKTKPDLTILLELPAKVLQARLSERHEERGADRIDAESNEFRNKVAKGFLELAKREQERFYRIETQGTKEETATLVFNVVKEVLL